MMKIRNPVFTSDNRIDCEVEHPSFGWVPFTADIDDIEPHGREIYHSAMALGPSEYIAPSLPAPTRAEQEFRRQTTYTAEADPLFFKWQAGEGTEEEWLAKRQEIRDRYPYPEEI